MWIIFIIRGLNSQQFWQISINFAFFFLLKLLQIIFTNWEFNSQQVWQILINIFFSFLARLFVNYFHKLRVQFSTSLANIDQYIFLFFWLDFLWIIFTSWEFNSQEFWHISRIFLFIWLNLLRTILASWEFNSQQVWQISTKISLSVAKPFANYFHKLRVQSSTNLGNINKIFPFAN